MGTITANGKTHTDPFIDTRGFLADTQPRRRGAVATNSHRWQTWAHHYKPNSNRQSMEWKHPTCLNTNRNSNLRPLQAKWCRSSWVGNGPILVQYFQHCTTAASYTIILKLKLKPVICNKCKGLLSVVVLLVHDNEYLHSAAAIAESIR
jgi:hypothetical protein